MDPDLAITICFGLVVLLFALGFAFYGVHEIHSLARRERDGSRAQEPPAGNPMTQRVEPAAGAFFSDDTDDPELRYELLDEAHRRSPST